MDLLIDCQHLTLEEKRRILHVLQRNDVVEQAELSKIHKLREEIQSIRKQSVIKVGEDPEKICARCRTKLGFIFDRGALCPKCHSKVCNGCQFEIPDQRRWLCRLCFKLREYEKVSGNWFTKKASKKQENRQAKLLPGSVLVKASIKRALGISSKNRSAADDLREALSGEDVPPILEGSRLSSEDQLRSGQGSTDSRGFLDLGNFRQRPGRDIKTQNGEVRIQKVKSRHYSDSSSSSVETSPVLSVRSQTSKPSASGHGDGSVGAQHSRYGLRALYKDSSFESDSQCSPVHDKTLGSDLVSDDEEFTVEELSKVKFHRVSTKGKSNRSRTPSPSGRHARSSSEASHPESGYSSSLSTSQQKPLESDTVSSRAYSKRLSDVSSVSVPSIEVTLPDERRSRGGEDEEDIDEVVKSHRSSKSTSSLLSPHGSDVVSESSSSIHTSSLGSKESINSFYSDAGEGLYGLIPVEGEIQFGLDYNYKTGTFIVHLKNCKGLAFADKKKSRTDPYVKTYLLPDKTRNGKRKSKVKKNTVNPSFDEDLRYTLCKSELESRTLWISVWHNDTFGRNAFLGEVMMPMDYHEFNDPTPKWHQLQERRQAPATFLSYKGDLILAIKFVPPEQLNIISMKQVESRGELHVCIQEARNLAAVRSNGFSDPFCKCYLLPDKNKHTKQKTPTIKKNCNPKWNVTLRFEDHSLEELAESSLELTIWDYDRIGSNQFLGGARLNLGKGTRKGSPTVWMDAKGEEVSLWQGMLEKPSTWIEGSVMLRPNMD